MSRMLATFSVGLAVAFLWQRYLSTWLERQGIRFSPFPENVQFSDPEDLSWVDFEEPEDLSSVAFGDGEDVSSVDFSDPEDLSDVTLS